jgi:multidrug efflux system membrane fusion protein
MTSLVELRSYAHEVVPHIHRPFGRKWVYIGGGGVALIVAFLFFRSLTSRPAPPAPPVPPVVQVTKVITRDVPLYLDEIGNMSANNTVKVEAQVSGQIVTRHFQEGAQIKKGDLLYNIDPRTYQAALGQAQGQLAQMRSQQSLDEVNLKRSQDLFAKGAIDKQDLDLATTTVQNDAAKTQAAEAMVTAAQVNLDFCEIRAPIDGRAGAALVDVGNIVTGSNGGGSGETLVTIAALDPIYTYFAVAQSDLPKVRPFLDKGNLQVQTQAPGDAKASRVGQVDFVDNTIQPGAGTLRMRASTPNADGMFWPVQFVRARLILDTVKDAKLVPAQAVQISQRGPYVFVVKPDGTVDLRLVKQGQPQEGGMVAVDEGLQPGETLVVTGQLALAPGRKVTPQPFDNQNQPQSMLANN